MSVLPYIETSNFDKKVDKGCYLDLCHDKELDNISCQD